MTDSDLIDLVARMRAAQKRYFGDRSNLDECKRLEREVDRAIEEKRSGPGLFGPVTVDIPK